MSAARSYAFIHSLPPRQFSKAHPPRITITKVTTILKNRRRNIFFTEVKLTRQNEPAMKESPIKWNASCHHLIHLPLAISTSFRLWFKVISAAQIAPSPKE